MKTHKQLPSKRLAEIITMADSTNNKPRLLEPNQPIKEPPK